MPTGVRPHLPLGVILLAVGCAALLLSLTAVLYWFPQDSSVSVPSSGPVYSGSLVEVESYELMTAYWTNNTTDTDYLASPECPPTTCPFYVTPGGVTTIQMTLEDNDTISHQVLSVVFDSPFTTVATTPTLPVTLAPNDPTVFDVEVQVPTVAAIYTATGTINTT